MEVKVLVKVLVDTGIEIVVVMDTEVNTMVDVVTQAGHQAEAVMVMDTEAETVDTKMVDTKVDTMMVEVVTREEKAVVDKVKQQYQVNGYTRYSELMQVLLVAEQNNQLVTLNHQARSTGSAPFPEANVVSSSYDNRRGRGRGCGGNCYHDRGRGRKRRLCPYDERDNKNFHENERNEKGQEDKRQTGKVCYRCGMKGHWVRSCRTPKHLADLYRESQKGKEKGRGETNFISDEPG
ncbi:uncharacterized protein LOC125608137 [Brassica napus]|uniref:uncharacterized protein LOC125608137 n=1 Tax=Brassica napus TaxID=3708 RepID=UPI002078A7EE|nr:uncharacterized protein LOC125608137 [Brassica napus]